MYTTIVTGSRDSGKSSWCRKALVGAGGSIAIKRFARKAHIGYDALNPISGETVPLLRCCDTSGSDRSRIGPYAIIEEGFRVSEQWILESRERDSIIIDEVGRLEFSEQGYAGALRSILGSMYEGRLYIVVRRQYIAEVIKTFSLTDTLRIVDLDQEVV